MSQYSQSSQSCRSRTLQGQQRVRAPELHRDAYRAYDLRSEVMHGSRSQDDEPLSRNVGLVHDLTREAIIGALSLHHLLTTKLGDGWVENMDRFYEQVTIQHKPVFDRLRKEFRKLAPSRSNLP
jgi:hypothetical protein